MSTPPDITRRTAQRERQERIRERVLADGFVRLDPLAHEFGVSLMTVHRDLDALEAQGWLRKVRGGATAQPSAQFHGNLRHRLQAMTEEKEALAVAALTLVEPGQSIMVDESTTALHLAQRLPGCGPLSVITHFLPAITLLAGQPGIDVIALGGAYLPAYEAFFGVMTADAARSLRADILFMSTTAVTDGRCYQQSQETIVINRAQMEASAVRVLMVDHSKLERRSLYPLAELTEFDLVLMDAGAPERDVEDLRALGVCVHVVGADGGTAIPPLATLRRAERRG